MKWCRILYTTGVEPFNTLQCPKLPGSIFPKVYYHSNSHHSLGTIGRQVEISCPRDGAVVVAMRKMKRLAHGSELESLVRRVTH